MNIDFFVVWVDNILLLEQIRVLDVGMGRIMLFEEDDECSDFGEWTFLGFFKKFLEMLGILFVFLLGFVGEDVMVGFFV